MRNKPSSFIVVGINAEVSTSEYLRSLMLKTLQGACSYIDVMVMPEPTNPYDANAIKVVLNGVKVGHIAKNDQIYFDFKGKEYLKADILSWGVTSNNEAVFLYITPYF